MIMINTHIGLQPYWIQPSMLERRFEFYSDNSLLGELRFEPGGKGFYNGNKELLFVRKTVLPREASRKAMLRFFFFVIDIRLCL